MPTSKPGSRRKSTKLAILIIGCIGVLAACNGRLPGEQVLFDFESDAELDRFHWRCHTLYSLSDEHITHGANSLKLEFFPSKYPGIAPMLDRNDWRGHKALCFDIYNPQAKALAIAVRIDDRGDHPDFADRYNRDFMIRPGMNRLRIPFDTLITSGTGRKLGLKKIYQLVVFMVRPGKKVVLYVDYIRLVS